MTILTLNMIIEFIRHFKKFKDKKDCSINLKINVVSCVLENYWLILNCLLQPSHNLIVLTIWKIKEMIIFSSLNFDYNLKDKNNKKDSFDIVKMVLFYNVIGRSCFFTQGNSNGVTTLLVSSGFVGVNSLNMFLVAIVVFFVTYSSNIFWLFCIVKHFTRKIFIDEFSKR